MDRFYRADPPRTTEGFGLSLARETVRAHGVSITLEEEKGDGLMTFVMTLPGAE